MPDATGKLVRLSDFTGKVILLDFWYIGCGPCAQLHPILDSMYKMLKGKDFELVSVCVDYYGHTTLSEWNKAILTGKYSSPDNTNLIAQGKEGKDPLITSFYHIIGCPTLVLLDKEKRICPQPVDPRSDRGQSLSDMINKLLTAPAVYPRPFKYSSTTPTSS